MPPRRRRRRTIRRSAPGRRADACTAIRTLAAVAAAQHDHHAKQAQAAAKIAQLKARLNMLKLLYARV